MRTCTSVGRYSVRRWNHPEGTERAPPPVPHVHALHGLLPVGAAPGSLRVTRRMMAVMRQPFHDQETKTLTLSVQHTRSRSLSSPLLVVPLFADMSCHVERLVWQSMEGASAQRRAVNPTAHKDRILPSITA